MTTPAIDWATTHTDLENLLNTVPSDDVRFLAGEAIRVKLFAVGTQYDAEHAALASLIAADDTSYATALSAWVNAAKVHYQRADQIARYIELLQLTAQTGVAETPWLAIDGDGNTFRLSPDVALPWPSPFADSDGGTQAARKLLASGTPIVRVVARDLGLLGNALRATVAAATSRAASRFKLTIACGALTEVRDELDAASETEQLGDWSDSLLVASVTRVGIGRPDNVSSAAFSGGSGRLKRNLDARCARALTLDAVTTTERRLLTEATRIADEVWSAKPTARNRLGQREIELQAALAEAAAMIAYLADVTVTIPS